MARKPTRPRPKTKPAEKARPPAETATQRKLVAIDAAMLRALTLLARDRMQDFQELADEAFRDLLKKHNRPVTLKEQMKQSVRRAAND